MKYGKYTRLAATALVLTVLLSLALTSCANTDGNGDFLDGGKQETEAPTIVKTELINGNLIVTYSDGRVENLGPLSGESDSDSLSFYPLPDGTYGITAGNTIYLEGISVPETYKGRAVTRILNDAFKGMKNLKSITLPTSIVSIGASAFAECESLEAVVIPEGVADIGASVFYGCKAIESVAIPESVKSIGSQAFYNCEALKAITLPEGDITIGGSAFFGTAYYDNEENWRDTAFYIGKHLIEVDTTVGGNYDIPDGTLTVANYAFVRCASLTGVTVPDSVLSIGDSAFAGCEMLQGVTLGKNSGLARIGEKAFMGCAAMKSFSVPNAVSSIAPQTFAECDKLVELIIDREGSALTVIDEKAFFGCDELTAIALPKGLESIEVSAFEACVKLETVDIDVENCSLANIGERAFYGCAALAKIIIPVTVADIGDSAFAQCVGVTEIEYGSVEDDWKKVTKGDGWSKNVPVEKITFAESEPISENNND